jgi:hypothetical protein
MFFKILSAIKKAVSIVSFPGDTNKRIIHVSI